MEGPRGLAMTSKFSSPSLITTASLSFSNVQDLGSFVFAPTGTSTSTLVGFVSTGQTITAIPEAQVALTSQQLQALHPADLTLVSTLLPVSIEATPTSVASTNQAQASSGFVVSVSAPGVNQPGLGNGPQKDWALQVEDLGGEAFVQADVPVATAAAPWEKYISGVDEAMEQLHQETLERTSRSPSAVEARAASPVAVDGQVAARLEAQAIESKQAIAASERVKDAAIFEAAALSIGVIFGPPAAETDIAAERGLLTSSAADARTLDRSDGFTTNGNEGGRGQSIAVSALLTVAVISPRAVGKWLKSKTIRRREGQPQARSR
jgi:hypothetical protein